MKRRNVLLLRDGKFLLLLEAADVATLNQLVSEHPEEWLMISPDRVPGDAPNWVEFTKKIECDISVVVPVSGAMTCWLATKIGSALASLVVSPDASDEVFINPKIRTHDLLFREVADPVADFVIRSAVANPAGINWAWGVASANKKNFRSLPRSERPPLLAPQTPSRECDWLRHHIESLPRQTLGEVAGSAADFLALQAGLWQVHDFLDESHQCSQQIEGEGTDRNGDYWHAIMHRREPDYDNSKYWFRRVGQHPVFQHLPELVKPALSECPDPQAAKWADRLCPNGGWDAFAFVDLCQTVGSREDSPLAISARRIQWAEILLLLVHSYRCVVGTRSLP